MQYRVTVNGKAFDVIVELVGEGGITATPEKPIGTPVLEERVVASIPEVPVKMPVQEVGTAVPDVPAPSDDEKVLSPFPGNIIEVAVIVGQSVTAGQRLVVLEAMKMENEIVAPRDGTVKEVLVTKGTNVNTDDLLVVI